MLKLPNGDPIPSCPACVAPGGYEFNPESGRHHIGCTRCENRTMWHDTVENALACWTETGLITESMLRHGGTLNDEIAVEVMGWTLHADSTWYWEQGHRVYPLSSWAPSASSGDAVRAIEKATAGGQWTSRRLPDGSYVVMGMAERGTLEKSQSIHEPTFAEAVSRLALAVVRRGKEQG